MVEESGGNVSNLENEQVALSLPVSNGQPEYADAGDLLDEGRSSSLSELEDGADEVDMVSTNSLLSKQLEADSEAETERLENSPNKNQDHKDAERGITTSTNVPSKLTQPVVAQDAEHETFSDSAVSSPGPSDEDLAIEMPSERSAASEDEENLDAPLRNTSPRKRKHLDIEDASGSDEGAEEMRRRRRRTLSVRSDVEEQSELGLSREATIEPLDEVPDDQRVSEAASDLLRNTQDTLISKSSKASAGKHGKSKSRETLKNIAEEGEGSDKVAEQLVDGGRPQSDEEERADGEDEDIEAAARDEEEFAKKMSAMDSLAALEKHFAALRDRLYDERIVALNEELAQLSAPKASHHEYLRQLECIRKYRDEKFDTEQKLLVYKIKSLKTRSVAQRSQIHSAYFQTVRDVREKHLDRIGERLSRVRRDHVKTDEKVPNYSIPFATRRSTQIMQQSSYNKEVSILSGVAKYVGFPAAPNVTIALQAEMDEDMEKMGISLNNVRSLRPTQSKLARNTFSSTMSRPAAEEQFLEQNPWANPQHPIHQQHMGRMSRQISSQTEGADATVTPATQKSLVDPFKAVDSASTIPEHPSAQASSALATPYGNNEELHNPTSEMAAVGSDQQHAAVFQKPQQQKDRLQSLSPTESRKHNIAIYDPGPSKQNSTGRIVASAEEPSSQPLKASRIALFTSPSRPESIPRNGPSHNEMAARNAASSPITVHQHGRENNLKPAAGLSRIGA